MIYLDNSATSWPTPGPVIEAVAPALRTGGSPGRGARGSALATGRTLLSTRRLAAELFHAAGPAQVILRPTTITASCGLAWLMVPAHEWPGGLSKPGPITSADSPVPLLGEHPMRGCSAMVRMADTTAWRR